MGADPRMDAEPQAAAPGAEAPELIRLTPDAAHKVSELAYDDGLEPILRVFVQGGGCSGFQYGFSFAEAPEEGDWSAQFGRVTLVADPMSLQYLVGAKIDYKETLQGASFVIENPNAQSTCGCGSSFSA